VFRQGIERLDLYVEEGTPPVPDDGRYHVLHGGTIVFSARSKGAAMTRYREIRDEALAGEPSRPPLDRDAMMARLLAENESNEIQAASSAAKRARATYSRSQPGRWSTS
jgi:hypothetical protein